MSRPVALNNSSTASIVGQGASDASMQQASETGKTEGRIVTMLKNISPETKWAIAFTAYSVALIILGLLIVYYASDVPAPDDVIRLTAGALAIGAGFIGLNYSVNKIGDAIESYFKEKNRVKKEPVTFTFQKVNTESDLRRRDVDQRLPEQPRYDYVAGCDRSFLMQRGPRRQAPTFPLTIITGNAVVAEPNGQLQAVQMQAMSSNNREIIIHKTKMPNPRAVKIVPPTPPRRKPPERPKAAVVIKPSATFSETIPLLATTKAKAAKKPARQIQPGTFYFARRGMTSFWS